MTAPALAAYGRGLLAAAAGAGDGWLVEDDTGRVRPLPLARWCGPLLPGDHTVLQRVTGATLDVGCGPGRMVRALLARGRPALGIDLAPAAVRLARRSGALALRRDVFGHLPGEGRWAHALLMDGNVGIGGDPGALLTRLRGVLGPGGTVLVELKPPGRAAGTSRLRLRCGDEVSGWFRWASLGVDGIADVAAGSGYTVQETWIGGSRCFATLTRRRSGA